MRTNETGFIFDMDGTLVDNMGYHVQAWKDFFKEMGKDIPVMELIPRIAGKPSEEGIKLTLGSGIPKNEIKRYVDRKEDIYRQSYAKQLEPIPGLVDFLNNSQALNIAMAIATSAPRVNIDFTIDGLNIRKYFNIIVGSDGIRNGKPDPEIFLTAADKLNILPSKCIVFEDSLIGIEAACRAGMKVIVVTTSLQEDEVINNPAVFRTINNYLTIDPKDIITG
jgi:beta-phosphoglucomutase